MGLWKNVRGESKRLKRLWGCFASEKKGKNDNDYGEINHKERKEKHKAHKETLYTL